MRYLAMFALLIISVSAMGADRVVLYEEFMNCGCSYCWGAEPSVNAFVNNHVGNGLAVIRVHGSWPGSDPIYNANPSQQNVREGFYNVTGVPHNEIDGVLSPSASSLEGAYSNRINQPTDLAISVARNGDDETGSISVRLIAEAEIGTTVMTRLFATVVEDDIPGAGHWSGSYFDQAFRYNLFGSAGVLVEFEAPYPDTLFFEADYDISSWVSDNLYLATFVQEYSSNDKEVINASWAKFMDLETGINNPDGFASDLPELILHSNPCVGGIQVSAVMPGDSGGIISVYDTAGRLITSCVASDYNSFQLDEPGLYIVRLESGGKVVTTRAIVTR